MNIAREGIREEYVKCSVLNPFCASYICFAVVCGNTEKGVFWIFCSIILVQMCYEMQLLWEGGRNGGGRERKRETVKGMCWEDKMLDNQRGC